FGNALAILGSGTEAQLVVIKATSLLVHLNLIYLVFRFRHPVAQWIAGPPDREGVVHALRQWLAVVWPLLAAVLIMGTWVVWAMGSEDGYTRVVAFIGRSAASQVVGRLEAVLLLGMLGRLADVIPDSRPPRSLRGGLLAQYYLLL